MTNTVTQFRLREYSQGVCQDGVAILCDGKQMTVEEIITRLRTLEDVRSIIYDYIA